MLKSYKLNALNVSIPILIGSIAVALASFWASLYYPGQKHIFLIFSFIGNLLFLDGFRKEASPFFTFLGAFLWLGFWVKTSVHFIFQKGTFQESYGLFDYSGQAFDNALVVCCIGLFSVYMASVIYNKIHAKKMFQIPKFNYSQTLQLYINYRFYILTLFLFSLITIAFLNISFGFYQKGSPPLTQTSGLFLGALKWLLIFGSSSFAAHLIFFELQFKKNIYFCAFLGIFEPFISSVSMLSRGMIFNSTAIIMGLRNYLRELKAETSFPLKTFTVIVFFSFFIFSIVSVNLIREYRFSGVSIENQNSASMAKSSGVLFIGRFVGIEGVLAVSSYPNLGWHLFKKAISENYNETGTSFYDFEIAKSVYAISNLDNRHFITLPGFIAFFYYPGSYLFLFISIISISLASALILKLFFALSGGNLVFSSLIGQLIAYRLVHFGYAPKQSYLLFGSMFATLAIFIIIELLLKKINCLKN